MTFLFKYKNEEQHTELVNIIMVESINHFKNKIKIDEEEFQRFKNDHYVTEGFSFYDHYDNNAVKVELANNLFFDDLNTAKCNMYECNDFIGLHDWISDIEENLYHAMNVEVL
jgi:hypothetical protein